MKQRVLVLILLLCTLLTYSQDTYNKSSIEAEIGGFKLRDLTSVELLNYNIGYRQMLNTKFGVKLDVGYSDNSTVDYYSSSLSGVLNMGRVLNFQSFTDRYTILGGVGGTYLYTENTTDVLHRLSNFHLSAFVLNEYKLTNRIFLQAGLDVITGVNSRPFDYTTLKTQTTSIINFNVGVVLALGKQQEHADWYLEETINQKDTIYLQPNIINNNYETIKVTSSNCNQPEFVYFTHDSDVVNIQGLNAIEKIATTLQNEQTIYIKILCSNVGNVVYNKQLADRRGESIVEKFRGIGINVDIEVESIGIDTTRDKTVYDMGRRAEITIIK